jgi:hypothetical protein
LAQENNNVYVRPLSPVVYNDNGYEPKLSMREEGETVAAIILFWILSYYLRHVTQFMAYSIATIFWGDDSVLL